MPAGSGEEARSSAAAVNLGLSQQDRRRRRKCPSCAGTSMIRGCRVPGVQLQVVTREGQSRSGLIALYSDVCVDCGLTSFYARRAEVAEKIERLGEALGDAPAKVASGTPRKRQK